MQRVDATGERNRSVSWILPTYLIETSDPLDEAVESMAGERSSGTFVDVLGETDEPHERHGAHVEHSASTSTSTERPGPPTRTPASAPRTDRRDTAPRGIDPNISRVVDV